MDKRTLNEFFFEDGTDVFTGGIFSYLQLFDVPWQDLTIAQDLNVLYHANKSGDKIISPLLEMVKSTTANKTAIAKTIFTRFGDKWAKKWEILQAQQLTNGDYSITESRDTDRTDNGSRSRTESGTNTGTVGNSSTTTNSGTVSVSGSSSEDTTDTGSSTTTTDNNTTTSNTSNTSGSVYGFNSAVAVPTDAGTGSGTGSETLDGEQQTTDSRTTGTDTTSSSTTTNDLEYDESSTRTDNLAHSTTESATDTGHREESTTITKSGYTGRRAPYDIARGWLDFWEYDFFNDVFRDIDKVLVIMVY